MILPIAVAVLGGLIGWAYLAIRPPPPKVCGTPGGPPVTSLRVKLADGRHLAYKELGVSKDVAKHKIIIVHGIRSSKDVNLPISQELIDELKLYVLVFDRAGYGDSDPYPARTVKTDATDIEELADILKIGHKFYVIGLSVGAYPAWGCLKYLPHRLAGVALVVPGASYWWPGFPEKLVNEQFQLLKKGDQCAFSVAHHLPSLFYWYMHQKVFPTLNFTSPLDVFKCPSDIAIFKRLTATPPEGEEKISHQGVHEAINRDIIAAYGKWEFDPMALPNPFPNDEGSVHMWQGSEDKLVPLPLNRHIGQMHKWIQYHEVPDAGHLMIYDKAICASVIRALVAGRE